MDLLGSYDSPTFLSQKDKYLMGLSLPELLLSMGVAFTWFIISLLLPYGTITRLFLMAPVTVINLILIFGRISGLTIPAYVFLSIVRSFARPSFEETGDLLLGGQSAWIESQRQKSEKSGFLPFVRKKRSVVMPDDIRQAELKAEMDKQITEGAVAAEGWVRDGFRTLMKGS